MKRGLSQETLKLIACLTMLIDHIGAVFIPGYAFRIIGRVAFPIFCFLLAEGAHHTRSRFQYALRLCLGALAAELPYDLLFYGKLTWQHQSVMVTLLLGFAAIASMGLVKNRLLQIWVVLPFALAGEWLRSDYGGFGVALIAMFSLTRETSWKLPVQTLCALLIGLFMPGIHVWLGNFSVPIQLFAAFAMVPIALYSGLKRTKSKLAQIGFYVFYPLHLTVLLVIKLLTE